MDIIEIAPEEFLQGYENTTMEGSSLYAKIAKCFNGKYDPKKKYLIALQGSSSSGKSTLANNMYQLFIACGFRCYLLELDKYYKTFEWSEDKIQREFSILNYNFDNPAALDWGKIHNTLRAIDNDEDFIPTYEYSFISKICSGPINIKNNYPNIIFVEGIFALNTINKIVFDLKTFSPYSEIENNQNEYIQNINKYRFNVLKVKLTVCKKKSLEIRAGRDVIQRGKSKALAIAQFEKFVWPATIKWVNNEVFEEDIQIIHGSFNHKTKLFIGAISFFFLGKCVTIKNLKFNGDFAANFNVECSGEC
ncbi:Uridine kinase, partial [Conglomerata obtusa]